MRENKFRGMSISTGKFVYGGLVRANTVAGNCLAIKDTIYNINNGKFNFIPEIVKSETVGQFTELKDKNGKEIYEGDILKWMSLELPITVEGLHGFRFMFGKDQLCKATSVDGEIVGNIYENR